MRPCHSPMGLGRMGQSVHRQTDRQAHIDLQTLGLGDQPPSGLRGTYLHPTGAPSALQISIPLPSLVLDLPIRDPSTHLLHTEGSAPTISTSSPPPPRPQRANPM